jgi:hypothetical protein
MATGYNYSVAMESLKERHTSLETRSRTNSVDRSANRDRSPLKTKTGRRGSMSEQPVSGSGRTMSRVLDSVSLSFERNSLGLQGASMEKQSVSRDRAGFSSDGQALEGTGTERKIPSTGSTLRDFTVHVDENLYHDELANARDADHLQIEDAIKELPSTIQGFEDVIKQLKKELSEKDSQLSAADSQLEEAEAQLNSLMAESRLSNEKNLPTGIKQRKG